MGISDLMEIGFSEEEAEHLLQHSHFFHKTKSAQVLFAVFQKIAEAYDCDIEVVKKAVMKFPQFAGLNHERVVREAAKVYGDEVAVKKAVMKFPAFANLNHERVVREAAAVYGDEEAVKKAVMKCPAFAGLNHERVVREKNRLRKLVGLSKGDVIEMILKKPALADYSAKRYIAALDVGRQLKKEGFSPDSEMLEKYFTYVTKSPYVPGTKRKRMSQCPAGSPEPPLLVKMRKGLAYARKSK